MDDKQLKKIEAIRVNINKSIELNTELTNSINFGQASRCSRISDSLESALDHLESFKREYIAEIEKLELDVADLERQVDYMRDYF